MKSGVTGVVCSHVDKDTGVSVLKLIFNMHYKYFLADARWLQQIRHWIPNHRYEDMCLVHSGAGHCSTADCDNEINMVNF